MGEQRGLLKTMSTDRLHFGRRRWTLAAVGQWRGQIGVRVVLCDSVEDAVAQFRARDDQRSQLFVGAPLHLALVDARATGLDSRIALTRQKADQRDQKHGRGGGIRTHDADLPKIRLWPLSYTPAFRAAA